MPAVKIVIRTAILFVPTDSISILTYNLPCYIKKIKLNKLYSRRVTTFQKIEKIGCAANALSTETGAM